MTRRGFWADRRIASITALSEATFPKNDLGAPDWESTQMVRRTLEYLDELPPQQRRLASWLYLFIELAAIFLVPGFRRFSKHSVERRAAVVRAWRKSRWLPFRILGDAIKATTTMIYMSHPSVLAYVGEYRTCAHPGDPVEVEVRPEALAHMGSAP